VKAPNYARGLTIIVVTVLLLPFSLMLLLELLAPLVPE
jgi:hypothetical protein